MHVREVLDEMQDQKDRTAAGDLASSNYPCLDLHSSHLPFCKLLMHIGVIRCDQTLEEDGRGGKKRSEPAMNVLL